MSTIYLGRALDVPADITPAERLLLARLGRVPGSAGVAFPSRGCLAKAANVSSPTVSRALRQLVKPGLIRRSRATTTGATWATGYRSTFENQDGKGSKGAHA
ncbi:helix-turn-helix domain-containing protein [Streptomyces sp. NPDC050428]|uniref:helix-turn-helix domain-containing protein n=1 Tax=Streptomyces sp. NPDC050428 TaxID=3155757 RepID=UPI00344830C0